MDMIMKQNIFMSSVIGGVRVTKEDYQLYSRANSIMIFPELMPWQKQEGFQNFSLFKVNRHVW